MVLNPEPQSHNQAGDFNGEGIADVLVTSKSGIAIIRSHQLTLEHPQTGFDAKAVEPGGTWLGQWYLNTADNIFGPVGDFDGDGRAEAFVHGSWGIGILKTNSNGMAAPFLAKNGTWLGDWLLKTVHDTYGPAADFDGDGAGEICVSSPWGFGILKQEGAGMKAVAMVQNGTDMGDGFVADSSESRFGPVGYFSASPPDGNARPEVLLISKHGFAVVRHEGNTLRNVASFADGAAIRGWQSTLQMADVKLGPVGDFDGDGQDEIFASFSSGIAILKLVAGELTASVAVANGTWLGGWLLKTVHDNFVFAGNFGGTNSKVHQVMVWSPWGVALLQQKGTTMEPIVMLQNGTKLFGGWTINTGDGCWFGAVAKYVDWSYIASKPGFLATSPWGLAVIQYADGNLVVRSQAANGTKIGNWTLNTKEDNFGM